MLAFSVFFEAKPASSPRVTIWGTATPRCDLMYADDMAEVAKLIARTVGFAGKIDYDRTKPDGTPRKLMGSFRLNALPWSATTTLEAGLAKAYEDFLMRQPSE